MHQARRAGIHPDPAAWNLERALVSFVEGAWTQPDEGIWEVRGGRRHFTHSKVMAWVAVDRAVKAAERFGLDGPVDEWKRLRAQIHEEVCRKGYDADRNTFTQYYGSQQLDASLLMIPLVGFPARDRRAGAGHGRGHRARAHARRLRDALPRGRLRRGGRAARGEGAFLACTFWLADNYILLGRTDEARPCSSGC